MSNVNESTNVTAVGAYKAISVTSLAIAVFAVVFVAIVQPRAGAEIRARRVVIVNEHGRDIIRLEQNCLEPSGQILLLDDKERPYLAIRQYPGVRGVMEILDAGDQPLALLFGTPDGGGISIHGGLHESPLALPSPDPLLAGNSSSTGRVRPSVITLRGEGLDGGFIECIDTNGAVRITVGAGELGGAVATYTPDGVINTYWGEDSSGATGAVFATDDGEHRVQLGVNANDEGFVSVHSPEDGQMRKLAAVSTNGTITETDER